MRRNKARANPRSPPSFLGIERRIAYRCKKYHSGWMCKGELDKSETAKFTGSADQSGKARAHNHIIHMLLMFTMSLYKKRWPNLIFSLEEAPMPPGTELPPKCNNTKCKITTIKMIKGTKKCKA